MRHDIHQPSFSLLIAFLRNPLKPIRHDCKSDPAIPKSGTELPRSIFAPKEELEWLQVMLVELPKHKGTDKMQADLKQKISRVKKEIAAQAGKGAGKGLSTKIPRQGAGRAVIIGGPNSGKSQLLASLTKAKPVIAEYPFSTTAPMPGMMPWNDVYVQLIDSPPITADVFDSNTLGLVRGADLVLLMLDLGSDDGGDQLMEVIRQFQATKTRLGNRTGFAADDIGVTYTRTILVENKIDLEESEDRRQFFSEFVQTDFETHQVSALAPTGLAELADRIYQAMGVIRVYTKLPTRKEPDMDRPFTLKAGQTVVELAELVHRDFAKKLKGARVWGAQVHDATQVKPDYELNDLDIVELNVSQ